MLAYVTDVITRFRRDYPLKPQHQPYPHINPTYGTKSQYAEAADMSPPLSKEDKTIVQEVTGTFFYYARLVDPTILTALKSIAAHQANPTEKTIQKVNQLLDYMVTHPDPIITYYAIDMVLAGHSDALRLSEKI